MSGTTSPRAGVPAATMPDPEDEDARHDDARPEPAAGHARRRRHRTRAGREPAEVVGRRPRLGQHAVEERTDRADDDEARPSSATLVPNSLVCGAISSVLATATRRPKTTRPTRPAGTVFGSVIMKNRKISTSGEVTITRQKSTPQTGANAQFAVMQWPGAGEDAEPDRERDPERRRQGEEAAAGG